MRLTHPPGKPESSSWVMYVADVLCLVKSLSTRTTTTGKASSSLSKVKWSYQGLCNTASNASRTTLTVCREAHRGLLRYWGGPLAGAGPSHSLRAPRASASIVSQHRGVVFNFYVVLCGQHTWEGV